MQDYCAVITRHQNYMKQHCAWQLFWYNLLVKWNCQVGICLAALAAAFHWNFIVCRKQRWPNFGDSGQDFRELYKTVPQTLRDEHTVLNLYVLLHHVEAVKAVFLFKNKYWPGEDLTSMKTSAIFVIEKKTTTIGKHLKIHCFGSWLRVECLQAAVLYHVELRN